MSIPSYEVFLKNLMPLVDKYFDEQKEFIKCQEGCANCCSQGNFPTSALEFDYVRIGFRKLTGMQQREIIQDAIAILKKRQKFIQDNDIRDFRYRCPFLGEDKRCKVYLHRPLICRIHGLILQDHSDEKLGLPYCVKEGLNYSDICIGENKLMDEKDLKKLGYKNIPKAYNIGYSTLLNLDESVEFGDTRMLIEWLILDLPNKNEIIQEIKDSVSS